MPSSYAINPDTTLIPDNAEVWLVLKSDVGDINDMIPATPDADLDELGWALTGAIDNQKGIPLTPSIEVKEYDAFGHPKFRVKLRNGKVESGFTALERNETVKKIMLPGSAPNRIGRPKDIQVYVLYRYIDEDRETVWVQLTPAPVELKSTSGVVDGELWWAEFTVHHTANSDGDVFEVVDSSSDDVVKTFTIPEGVTAYTVTVTGDTSASITTKTKAALQSALRALASVTALPSPGVTVDGPDGGPLAATFTGPVTGVSATGTGGTVVVA